MNRLLTALARTGAGRNTLSWIGIRLLAAAEWAERHDGYDVDPITPGERHGGMWVAGHRMETDK